MAIKYVYGSEEFETEADAQAAAAALAVRMENNPTDWMVVKEITGSNEDGWLVSPTELTDNQIENLDATKKYLAYSVQGSNHDMPLTAAEVTTKRDEYRAIYGQWKNANFMQKIDDSTTPPTETEIDINTDMSGYV